MLLLIPLTFSFIGGIGSLKNTCLRCLLPHPQGREDIASRSSSKRSCNQWTRFRSQRWSQVGPLENHTHGCVRFHLLIPSGLRQLGGSRPCKPAFRFSTARAPMARRVSAVALPIWGSKMTLSSVSSPGVRAGSCS